MKGSSEEAALLSQYTFSLRAASHIKANFSVQHSFRPQWCEQGKRQSPLPNRSRLFSAQSDRPTSSLKIEPKTEAESSILLAPKPTTHYCQVCREKFEDYLKHISHPLHKQKSKQVDNDLDFNFLQEVINKSGSKKRKSPAKEVTFAELDLELETSPSKCEEEHDIEGQFLSGSKKRIVVNEEGDLEAVSLSGSTKAIEEEPQLGVRRSERQVIVSKKIKV